MINYHSKYLPQSLNPVILRDNQGPIQVRSQEGGQEDSTKHDGIQQSLTSHDLPLHTQCAYLLKSSLGRFWIINHYQIRAGQEPSTMGKRLGPELGQRRCLGVRPFLRLMGGEQGQVSHHWKDGTLHLQQILGMWIFVWCLDRGLEVRRLLGFINLKGKKMYRITWNVYSSILTEGERKHRNITYLSPKENELVSAGWWPSTQWHNIVMHFLELRC